MWSNLLAAGVRPDKTAEASVAPARVFDKQAARRQSQNAILIGTDNAAKEGQDRIGCRDG